jgi:hypothetical protein
MSGGLAANRSASWRFLGGQDRVARLHRDLVGCHALAAKRGLDALHLGAQRALGRDARLHARLEVDPGLARERIVVAQTVGDRLLERRPRRIVDAAARLGQADLGLERPSAGPQLRRVEDHSVLGDVRVDVGVERAVGLAAQPLAQAAVDEFGRVGGRADLVGDGALDPAEPG